MASVIVEELGDRIIGGVLSCGRRSADRTGALRGVRLQSVRGPRGPEAARGDAASFASSKAAARRCRGATRGTCSTRRAPDRADLRPRHGAARRPDRGAAPARARDGARGGGRLSEDELAELGRAGSTMGSRRRLRAVPHARHRLSRDHHERLRQRDRLDDRAHDPPSRRHRRRLSRRPRPRRPRSSARPWSTGRSTRRSPHRDGALAASLDRCAYRWPSGRERQASLEEPT